jgi:hypothetical protein
MPVSLFALEASFRSRIYFENYCVMSIPWYSYRAVVTRRRRPCRFADPPGSPGTILDGPTPPPTSTTLHTLSGVPELQPQPVGVAAAHDRPPASIIHDDASAVRELRDGGL